MRHPFIPLFLYSLILFSVGWEEGGDDAKSAWPFDALGYTRVTIAGTTRRNTVRWSKP